MNHKEIIREFLRDLQILKATTLVRLQSEYDRERKKLKIKGCRPYPKVYHVKTKAKNQWMIFLSKSPGAALYKTKEDACYNCVVHYHNNEGLVVLREFKEINGVECFWGHFFKRYNERMGLNISSVRGWIEHFFVHNGYIQQFMSTTEAKRSIGVCKEGLVFGQLQYEDTWLVNKTFVSHQTVNKKQHRFTEKLMALVQDNLIAGLVAKEVDEATYQWKREVLTELKRA